jgi:hypothetical protein
LGEGGFVEAFLFTYVNKKVYRKVPMEDLRKPLGSPQEAPRKPGKEIGS